MALMFQRLARNFIKNGYFPTDADTTQRLLQAIEPCPAGELRILDPCCGEGVALAEVKHHLDAERTTAYGVEYDEERAWHAKTLLDHCIHGDLQDCVIGRRQFGLLWLNPPYGDLVTDRQGVATSQNGRKRLEKLFYQRCHPDLQYGGLLVLIVPVYALDRELSGWIATHFDRVRVFGAAVDTFRQVVVLGRRRRADGTEEEDADHPQHRQVERELAAPTRSGDGGRAGAGRGGVGRGGIRHRLFPLAFHTLSLGKPGK